MTQNVIVGIVIGLLVVGRFLARELRWRRFVVARIYVLPGILALLGIVFAVVTVVDEPAATGLLLASIPLALALGAALGYGVAHFTKVRVTDDRSVVFSRGSYITVAIWLVALALRVFARYALLAGGSLSALHESLALNAALFFVLASALFFVRYRLLQAAARERALGIAVASPAI